MMSDKENSSCPILPDNSNEVLQVGLTATNVLLCGDFTPTDRDIALYEMAERYHADCEAYDQIHCSFTNERGVAMPGSYYELAIINRNATSVKKRLAREYDEWCFTAREVQNAISKWHG